MNFNPRARVGRDWGSTTTTTHDFNPRARVGRDLDTRVLLPLLVISIHAPAWGATADVRGYTSA